MTSAAGADAIRESNPATTAEFDRAAGLLGRPFTRSAPMMWHHPTRYNQRHALAIRDGDWKLLVDPDGTKAELYDLARDVGEKQNRAADRPETAARLSAAVRGWYNGLPKPHPRLLNLNMTK